MKQPLFNLLIFSVALLASLSTNAQNEGKVDLTFNNNGGNSGVISQILELKNKSTLICGQFTKFNGVRRSSVAFVDDTSALTDVFLSPLISTKAGLYSSLISPAIELPSGKILMFNGITKPRIYRYNPDGTKDSTFDPGLGLPGGGHKIIDAKVQPDGKIVLCGTFQAIMGFYLTRLNANGSRDTSFKLNFNFRTGHPNRVLILKDGDILIAGNAMKIKTTKGDIFRFKAAILDKNGTYKKSVAAVSGEVNEMVMQSDGKVVYSIAGSNFSYPQINRIDTNTWKLDPTFTISKVRKSRTNPTAVYDICVQPDDKLIIGGNFTERSHGGANYEAQVDTALFLFRLTKDGKNDSTFYMNAHPSYAPNFSVTAVSYTRRGHILIGGNFWKIGEIKRYNYARLMGDGKEVVSDGRTIVKNKMSIYPNPATNSITLNTNVIFETIKLYNSMGELVKVFTNRSNEIDVSDLKTGVYAIIASDGETLLSAKFVKN